MAQSSERTVLKLRWSAFHAGPSKQGCKAALFGWTSPKKSKAPNQSLETTGFRTRPMPFSTTKILRVSRLTLSDCERRKDSAKAVVDSTPGDPSLQGHAAPAVVLPKGDSHPAARPVTTHVMDALTHAALVRHTTPYLAALQQSIRLAEFCANLCPSLSSGKRRALLPLLQPL